MAESAPAAETVMARNGDSDGDNVGCGGSASDDRGCRQLEGRKRGGGSGGDFGGGGGMNGCCDRRRGARNS